MSEIYRGGRIPRDLPPGLKKLIENYDRVLARNSTSDTINISYSGGTTTPPASSSAGSVSQLLALNMVGNVYNLAVEGAGKIRSYRFPRVGTGGFEGTVTLKDRQGNLRLQGDFTPFGPYETITLMSDGQLWWELSRSESGRPTFIPASTWDAVPGTGADMTAKIQKAFDKAPIGSTLYFAPGAYTLTGSITVERKVNVWAYGAIWNYAEATVLTTPAFKYGKPSFGQFENCSVAGLKITRGYTPVTGAIQTSALKYTAFDWYGLFSCTIQDCITQGFQIGHLVRGGFLSGTPFGNSLNHYINLTSRHPTRYALWIENGEAGGGAGAYCNNNYFLGGRAHIATNDAGTTWIEDSENTAALWIEYPDVLAGSIPNGHVFVGTDLEGSGGNGGGWGRKLYCHGEDLTMVGCRWERPKGNSLWFGDNSGTYTLPAVTVTLDGALDTVNAVGHGFSANDPVYLTTTLTLPTELKAKRTYWARDVAANSFKLAATNGGAAINFTGNGTGVITCTRTVDIEIDHTGARGGANISLKDGVDLYAQDIALINGATRVARESTAQTDYRGIPITMARGGSTGPLAVWNTSGGNTPAFTLYDSSGPAGHQKLHLHESVESGASVDQLAGLSVKNLSGTEVNRFGAMVASPNPFFMVKGLIVNDEAGDNDFQVKGDTDVNTLYVDASALAGVGAVGIGTATPGAKLDVAGSTTLNSGGTDNDTVVKGNTDDNLLVVDAGNDCVVMGAAAPVVGGTKCEVVGEMAVCTDSLGGVGFTVRSADGSAQFFNVNTDSGEVTASSSASWVAAGPISMAANIFVAGISTPGAWAANQNDWAASSTLSVFRISASAAVDLTGITGGTSGRVIILINVGTGTNTITLKHDVTSTAANRIYGVGGADTPLHDYDSAILWYDGTNSRWRIIGGAGIG